MVFQEYLVLQLFFVACVVCNPLDFLKHYETLNYDTNAVHNFHERAKRSLEPNDAVVNLKFRSHGRIFHLRLRRDTSAFGGNHVADVNGRPLSNVDLSFLYSGELQGDSRSYVSGSIFDGMFDGQIRTSENEIYHVEKLSKYEYYKEDDTNQTKSPFHSIIYADDAIDHDKIRVKRHGSHSGCGLNSETSQWMGGIQRSASPESISLNDRYRRKSAVFVNEMDERPWVKYSAEYQSVLSDRFKRDQRASIFKTDPKNGLYEVRTCSLYMQADQKLWDHIYTHEGQKNYERTRDEIFSLFNSHIKAVNAIYEDTDFNGIKGINFVVQRTTIYDSKSCPNSDMDKGNPFCEENVDVSNYLNLNSIKNHSDFCLAYALTYRDFVGGTLGLAWVASPQPSTSGGICEVYKAYSEGGRKVRRSLNTGIITLVNYNNRVPPKVSQLTLAHEIGHNFGSPHDFPSYCQPGLPDGNYIMFASATSGDKPNNAKFSVCSINNISAVLYEVLRQSPFIDLPGNKRNCFQTRSTSFCGNALVEENEECDCGFDDAECQERHDRCCYPRTHTNPEAKGCTLLPSMQCSPTQGVCCSRNCRYIEAGPLPTVCRQASECSEQQFCDGTGPACPPSRPKLDGTLCQENTKTCVAGSCNRSVCEVIGMEECFLTGGTPETQCHLACKGKNDPQMKCASSFNIEALRPYYQNKTGRSGVLLRPGSPCNDYRGYCDIFQKCRSVDSNGPLSRLKNLLFNSESFRTAREWVQDYWWAVVLMGIALLLFMALFIKCCAVHTPSTNPRKPPAQSIYETLRRPATLLRGQSNTRREHRQHHHHHHRHRHHRHRSRSQQQQRNGGAELSGNRATALPPVPSTSPPQVPPTETQAGPSTAGLEPPPPYSAVASDPPVQGPPRGHRKHRKRSQTNPPDTADARPKRV